MPFTRDRLRSATSSEKTPFFFLGNFRFFFFLLSFFFFFSLLAFTCLGKAGATQSAKIAHVMTRETASRDLSSVFFFLISLLLYVWMDTVLR